MDFVCPKCSFPLVCEDGVAKCKNNHTYDRAKAGYYNLLLTNVGGTHGDNREMVEARRVFLETGAYKPLADRVASLAGKYISGTKLLDIGCGEGYYTNIIENALRERGVLVSGFDISRDAVKYALRRNRNLSLAVASAYRMPTADESFDMAVNMFSPLAADEVYRTLKQGGIFIMAIPGENHLFGLKSVTYKTPYKNEVADSAIPGFELLKSEKISFNLKLDTKEKIQSLFMMTPYAYRTKAEDKMRVFALDCLETEIEFVVFVYKKQ